MSASVRRDNNDRRRKHIMTWTDGRPHRTVHTSTQRRLSERTLSCSLLPPHYALSVRAGGQANFNSLFIASHENQMHSRSLVSKHPSTSSAVACCRLYPLAARFHEANFSLGMAEIFLDRAVFMAYIVWTSTSNTVAITL